MPWNTQFAVVLLIMNKQLVGLLIYVDTYIVRACMCAHMRVYLCV